MPANESSISWLGILGRSLAVTEELVKLRELFVEILYVLELPIYAIGSFLIALIHSFKL